MVKRRVTAELRPHVRMLRLVSFHTAYYDRVSTARRGRAQERVQQGRIKMRESTRNMKNVNTPQNVRPVAHEQLPPQYGAQLLTAAQTQPYPMGSYTPEPYYTVPPKNVTPLQRATKQREKAILYACLIVATVIMFPHFKSEIGFVLLVILTLLMVISIARE